MYMCECMYVCMYVSFKTGINVGSLASVFRGTVPICCVEERRKTSSSLNQVGRYSDRNLNPGSIEYNSDLETTGDDLHRPDGHL